MEFWFYLFILSVALLVVSLLVLVLRWPLGIHKTFSMHAAQTKQLSAYYTVTFALTMPLMALSLFMLSVSVMSLSFFVIATITQIACTFFPEKGTSKSTTTHRILAGISAASLFAVLVSISLTESVAAPYAVTGAVTMAIVSLFALLLQGRFALLLQAVFYTAFFVPMIIFIGL